MRGAGGKVLSNFSTLRLVRLSDQQVTSATLIHGGSDADIRLFQLYPGTAGVE